jgi:hypothetical protein
MRLKFPLIVGFSFIVMSSMPARAEGPKEERREDHAREAHHEEHHEGHAEGRPAPPPRAAPPRFQGHPPGAHPHGAVVHSHPVRVLAPRVIRHGGERPWRHWGHADFARPLYYWDWGALHNVTCTAEDSYGDQYPVTESTFAGFGLVNMTGVEDDALDRCYAESGGDQTCYLATCSHF